MTRAKHARSTTTGRKLAAGALSVPMALTMAGTAAATEPVAAETTIVASSADELLAHDALAAKPAKLPAQAAKPEKAVKPEKAGKAEVAVEGTKTEAEAETAEDGVVVTAKKKTVPARPAPAGPATEQPAAEREVKSNGTTCDKLGYTKVDRSSGSVRLPDGAGTISWSGSTLNYVLADGYTIELCVKGGNEVPITEFVADGEGKYVHPQGISHIGYRTAVLDETAVDDDDDDDDDDNDNNNDIDNGSDVDTDNGNGSDVDTDTDTDTGTGTDIGGVDGGTGTGTPPSNGGGAVVVETPVVETPVVNTPVVPALPISGRPAPTAGTGVVNTGATAPQAFAPTRGAGVSTASPSALPYTGSTTSLLLALGAGLVVVGGGMTLSGRRETLAPTA